MPDSRLMTEGKASVMLREHAFRLLAQGSARR